MIPSRIYELQQDIARVRQIIGWREADGLDCEDERTTLANLKAHKRVLLDAAGYEHRRVLVGKDLVEKA